MASSAWVGREDYLMPKVFLLILDWNFCVFMYCANCQITNTMTKNNSDHFELNTKKNRISCRMYWGKFHLILKGIHVRNFLVRHICIVSFYGKFKYPSGLKLMNIWIVLFNWFYFNQEDTTTDFYLFFSWEINGETTF